MSSEFKRLSTWLTLGSRVRSHSHAVTRLGRPKSFRKSERALLSHSCTARVTPGEPANFSGTPSACEIMSHSTSASGRLKYAREKFRSSFSLVAFGVTDVWYTRELVMSTISFRTSYLFSTRFFASASSSSGFEGGLVARTSSTGSTKPRPSVHAHTRLATFRAKNGLSGLVIHSASGTRRSPVGFAVGISVPSAYAYTSFFVRGCVVLPVVKNADMP